MSEEETPEPDFEDATGEGEFDEADELEAALTQVADLKEKMLRVAADAENAKRRAEREANDARAFAIQKFSRDLLGVADNLARALAHTPSNAADPAVKNLVVGLEMTEKELIGAFERNGLMRLNPMRGDKFDPNFHQAMSEQNAADVAPGGVIQVMQVGYELMGRLIRPAMVIVADKASGSAVVDAGTDEAAAQGNYPEGDGDTGGTVDTKA